MTPREPTPWLQGEVDAELRSMLESTSEDVPTSDQLVALHSALATLLIGPGVGAGAAASGGTAAAAKGAVAAKGVGALALSGVTKTVIAVAVASSVVGGVALQRRSHPAPPAPVIEAVAPRAPAPAVDPVIAEPSAVPEPEVTPLPAPRPAQQKAAAVAPAPEPAEAAGETPPPAKVSGADAELTLLQDAMDAVQAGRPREALEALDSHAGQFAAGALVQEREVLAIDALVSLGRLDEARARANRFRAAYPASTHLLHIDSLVGREP